MNKYYSINAPAKLNLNLFIKGKNKDGYHSLESDVCFLELTDKIYIKKVTKIYLIKVKHVIILTLTPTII